MTDSVRTGALLRLSLLLSRIAHPIAHFAVRRRLARGKEHPDRFTEKFGVPSLPRPGGTLIWMHAVGVGELLALPGLANALRERCPAAHVLLTSTSRTSAEAIADNLPDGSRHQFLPVACTRYVRAFLDHWQPDISVWAERDIWPAFVVETHRRGTPLALVNGRMDHASFRAKRRVRGFYSELYGRFAVVVAQDEESAERFAALGTTLARIRVAGSLKAGAPPLADRQAERAHLTAALTGRRVWLAASTHADDEAVAADAHRLVLDRDPSAMLAVVPRDPRRARAVAEHLGTRSIRAAVLGDGSLPAAESQAIVIDRIGRLGIWYRIADRALIGGSLGDIGGHNPHEPARLDCAIIHGPFIRNFRADYAAFQNAGGARLVKDAAELADAVLDPELAKTASKAASVSGSGARSVAETAEVLLSLLEATREVRSPSRSEGWTS